MVAGDVVNTASRLQQHAPVGEIVVGEETYRATQGAIEYEAVDAVTAKGKTAPIRAWRAVATATAGGERHLSSTPFVGRGREVDLLDATWERVESERRPHLITVLGAPGVGKSRLSAEFTERVSSRGGRVVRGRCLPYRERSPYGAFAMQVKELAGIYDSDDVAVATEKLRTLVERLVVKDEAETVAGHIAILLGFETHATTPIATASSSRSGSSSKRGRATRLRRSCSRTSTGQTRASSTSSSSWRPAFTTCRCCS